MLRTCLNRCSQTFASTSAFSLSSFHTSALRNARNSNIKLSKKAKQAIKHQRWEREQATKPNPVLGTRPGEESKWLRCDLAKVLVDESALLQAPPHEVEQPIGSVRVPSEFAFGVTEEEKGLLLGQLPQMSVTANSFDTVTKTQQMGAMASTTEANEMTENDWEGTKRELKKVNAFTKLIDLKNADAKGIAFENRRRIIVEFSTPENPFDTGRTEVQAALLTYKIRKLWDHLIAHKRDLGNRRGLRKLVHQRAKLLRYLRRTDRLRYDMVLERLALEPEAVEGELIV